MKMKSVKLVYFSPTGTTKAVIQGIAQGFNPDPTVYIDITTPKGRKKPIEVSENELLVIAVPVYMGRVPAILIKWLNAIKAYHTPAVCVVVYGNRVYEDALLELKNIMISSGCKIIAGAAFIGEHSFSCDETPTAKGRPDDEDLKFAELFGRKIQEKLNIISSVDQVPDADIPGRYPYRGDSKLWTVDFIAVSDVCNQCGTCAEGCPVGAIDPNDSNLIDTEKCITCCACIKRCPQKARAMKPGLVKDASARLNSLYRERKEPEWFL
jgi:ferredoxin